MGGEEYAQELLVVAMSLSAEIGQSRQGPKLLPGQLSRPSITERTFPGTGLRESVMSR
jgi:hypothetical protein